jgi:hypothetical protein
MGIKFANSAYATLASGINSSATSITLTTGQGARFPSLSGGDYFYATLIDTSNNLEIVKCTARSTDVLTVTRGQESTTARAFSTGDRIELRVTAAGITESANELIASGTLVIPGTSSSGAIIRLSEDTDNGTHYVGLKAAASIASSFDFTLPSADGTNGQFMKTDGSGVLSFGTVTQRLVQSQFVYKQDIFTTTSTSYVDVTGLSVSITPTSASNYIMVLGAVVVSNSGDMGVVQLVRDSTPIQVGTAASLRYAATADFRSSVDTAQSQSVALAYRDSPATTSSVTYKIQASSRTSGTTRINSSGDDADQTNRGRFASTILLLEVAP